MSKHFDRLDELIPAYALNKSELDSYKKICDKENAEIKKIMTDLVLSKYETEDYKIVRTVQNRSKMNEEMLINMFTSMPAFTKVSDSFNIVKERPYIDFDALENAIYKGEFSDEQLMELNKATEVKEVVTLRLSKKKKKEK